jgi:hypothetical protein
MSRKSMLWSVGGIAVLFATLATLAWVLLTHEPDFYRRSAVPPGPQRKQWSGQCNHHLLTELSNGISNKSADWGTSIREEQLNSFMEEDFFKLGTLAKSLLPERVSAPRVAIDGDRLRLGFRYGGERWNTIVSIDLRVWMASKEPNVVALEVQGMRAGALPISLQSLLERFSEALRQQDIDMTWYRHDGKPVALLHFGTRKDPSVQLVQVKLQPGVLTLHGVTRTKPPPSDPAPAKE